MKVEIDKFKEHLSQPEILNLHYSNYSLLYGILCIVEKINCVHEFCYNNSIFYVAKL